MSDTSDSDADGLISPGELLRFKRANAAHLVDLKRANCSPKYCELVVDPRTDRILALPQRRPAPGRKPTPAPIVQPLLLRKRS